METKIVKFCKKCNAQKVYRLVKVDNYYACSGCTERNSKAHRKNHWYKYLAQKANARKREGSTKMTGQIVEALAIKQDYKCAVTNQKLDIESKWWKPSLDRIDSNLGYTIDNIRIVAWIVNHCRGDLTDEEFFDMCKKVVIKD